MTKSTTSISSKRSQLLQPRLCHLFKWPDYDGFGFDLITKKDQPGHFIGNVDKLGPADLSGLRDGDRVIEINGRNVQSESHETVTELIKSSNEEVKLLLVDEQLFAHCQRTGTPISRQFMSYIYVRTPEKMASDDVVPVTFESYEETKMGSSEEHTETEGNVRTIVVKETTRREGKYVREHVEMQTFSKESKEISDRSVDSGISLPDGPPTLPPPRMCHLIKGYPEEGYGFSLNTRKDSGGHFISKIDENSAASLSGIKIGDRLIEVNGNNIELASHNTVTDMIRKSPKNEVKLLVVEEELYQRYCDKGIEVTSSLPNIIYIRTPERAQVSIKTVGAYAGQQEPVEEVITKTKIENTTSENFQDSRDQNSQLLRAPTVPIEIVNGETDLIDAPSPRLCHLVSVPQYQGFGFALRTYTVSKSKYILDIKDGSPASYSGLRNWDRLIEINAINVNVDNHAQACARIEMNLKEVKLLVLEEEEFQWYQKKNLVPKGSQSNVIYLSNIVENAEVNSKAKTTNSNVYNLSTSEVREMISTRKKQDPRDKNVEFQRRLELYEKM
ncbi:uncharacterized protein B4U79_11669 [Dinothrombium tinctorium]|uniref:PDZ domain-containing protein n=1 Tax=Dinothrombium tinctorium TaxID=1965070 RepID=A0A3S3PKQ0_9ACAR|nr:uncharacterized protein B4U79_11669 [Dinothrombium tinctorium]